MLRFFSTVLDTVVVRALFSEKKMLGPNRLCFGRSPNNLFHMTKFSEYMKWKKRRFNSDGIIALNDAQSQGGMNYFKFVK